MSFAGRLLVAMTVAFILFPVAFVLWHGPDADFGFVGGIVMMMFVQFISPYGLWLMPICGGTALALAWHGVAEQKATQQTES